MSSATHGTESSRTFQSGPNTPPGRTTRAISSRARSFANQWKRLRGDDGVDAFAAKRHRLGRAGDRRHAGRGLLEHRAHPRVGLDRDHLVAERGEDAAELPGPGAEIDHAKRRVSEDPAGRLRRIRGPDLVVQRGGRPEREPPLVEPRRRQDRIAARAAWKPHMP